MDSNDTRASLLKSGLVVCCKCLFDNDEVDRKLKHDGTYGQDKCDRCGVLPSRGAVQHRRNNLRVFAK